MFLLVYGRMLWQKIIPFFIKTIAFIVVIIFFCIFARFFMLNMRKYAITVLVACLCLIGCGHAEKNAELIHRVFFDNVWERFDYVRNEIEIKEKTTYDLSIKISFTEDYPYDDFSMIFTIFSSDNQPYRSKGYKFNLKDDEGHWNSQLADGCYTFNLPINKNLTISDPGVYCFQIENHMPITPLVGVKELTLYNNLKNE